MPFRRSRFVPAAVTTIAAAAAIALVVASHMLWVDAFDRQAPRARLSAAIRERTAIGHLWLEEGIAGDRSIEYGRDVQPHFDAVLGMAGAARNGGDTEFGRIIRVADPKLQSDLSQLEGQVRTLSETARKRWDESGAPGTARDQAFDQLFREVLALASTIGAEIDALIAEDRRAVMLTNGGIVALFLILLAGLHLILGRHRRALQKHAAELEARVAERTAELRAGNEELALARDRADDANRAKSAFLANMSHEIRTPMNAVIGMSSLLRRSELTQDQLRSVDVVEQSSAALLRIIDDILDLSKVEAGRMTIESRQFNLAKLVRQCADVFREEASNKGILLSVALEPGVPEWVGGDPSRLRQILINLLGNAVKFTESGGVALVVSRSRGVSSAVRFEVRDTGLGIAAEDRHALFRPFSQVDQSRTRKFGGTGLGLAISKRLVDLMDGEIGVESEPGKGSVFWCVIPFGSAEPPVGAEEGDARPAEPLRGVDGLEPILVVEDHALNREVATKILALLGLRSHAVAGGKEALREVARNRYAAILMDSEMPGLDGCATIAAIRGRESAASHIPIVMVTAHAMEGERERALAAGADGYLAKPVTPETLAAALAAAGLGAARPEPAGFSGPLTDPSALDRLRALGGSQRGFAGDILGMFFSDAPARIATMREAVLRRDGKSLRAEAHRLIGSSKYVGAETMSRTLAAIQAAAMEDAFDEAQGLVARLDREFDATRAELAHALEPDGAGA